MLISHKLKHITTLSAQEGKSTYKRRPSYLPSVISISLVLFMLGLFGLLIISGNKLAEHIRENIQLNIFLKDELTEADIQALQQSLEQESFTRELKYVSKEQAAKDFSRDMGHDFVSFIGYNPLQASFELKLKSEYADVAKVLEIEKTLRNKSQVGDVTYQQNLIERVNENLQLIATVVLSLSAIFFIVAITLINNTIRLNLYARRFLIKSMQLVGATRWFIVKPFMFRSMLHGVYGAVAAGCMLIGVLYFLPRKMAEIESLYDYEQFGLLFALILLLGVIISVLSSFIATMRYLRLKLDDLY